MQRIPTSQTQNGQTPSTQNVGMPMPIPIPLPKCLPRTSTIGANAKCQMHKCQMHKCTNAQTHECHMPHCHIATLPNAQMHKCTNAQKPNVKYRNQCLCQMNLVHQPNSNFTHQAVTRLAKQRRCRERKLQSRPTTCSTEVERVGKAVFGWFQRR